MPVDPTPFRRPIGTDNVVIERLDHVVDIFTKDLQPIKWPNAVWLLGLDLEPTANKSNDEIREYIGAKSLKFLSIDGLYRAIGFEKRNETYPQLTDHYFTGDYPVKIIDELGEDKVTQLSLLSSASNN